MNILYITALIPHLAKGPVYSIPPQIKSQSKLDNVLWYNLIDPFSVKAQLWTYSSLWKKLFQIFIYSFKHMYININRCKRLIAMQP